MNYKKAFQSNAKCPLANSTVYVVNNFEHAWARGAVQWGSSWTNWTCRRGLGLVQRGRVETCALYGGTGTPCEQTDTLTNRHDWKHYLHCSVVITVVITGCSKEWKLDYVNLNYLSLKWKFFARVEWNHFLNYIWPNFEVNLWRKIRWTFASQNLTNVDSW